MERSNLTSLILEFMWFLWQLILYLHLFLIMHTYLHSISILIYYLYFSYKLLYVYYIFLFHNGTAVIFPLASLVTVEAESGTAAQKTTRGFQNKNLQNDNKFRWSSVRSWWERKLLKSGRHHSNCRKSCVVSKWCEEREESLSLLTAFSPHPFHVTETHGKIILSLRYRDTR